MQKRLLLLSDLHLCHIEWYGLPSRPRLDRMLAQVRASNDANPIDEILMLGDYSLDFWQWSIGGSYLHTPPVSNTEAFVREYAEALPLRPHMIAGNHEQYGAALWKQITGCERQFALTVGGWRVLMLDTFGGDLDPKVHSDGTYTGPDEAFIRAELAKDDMPTILCAHHFDPNLDSPSVRALIRDEPRIKALFAGHTHQSIVESYEGKPLLRTGHYAYAVDDIRKTMFGYREVLLDDHSLSTRYITPENDIVVDGEPYHHPFSEQDSLTIAF